MFTFTRSSFRYSSPGFADVMDGSINKLFGPKDSPFIRGIEFRLMAKFHASRNELSVSLSSNCLLHTKVTKHRIDINYSRPLQTQIGTMSTVFVLLRFLHHPGTHRIKMDIAHQLTQIPIALTQN